MFPSLRRIAPFAAVAAMLLVLAACGKTPPFEFTTETPEVALGTAVVEVRLKNTTAGTFVSDAVITATRLDMGPDGMRDMTSAVAPLGMGEPGVYRFNARFTMAGQWALTLSARVPGEADPVTGSVTFRVR
jgi:hypothetical protein